MVGFNKAIIGILLALTVIVVLLAACGRQDENRHSETAERDAVSSQIAEFQSDMNKDTLSEEGAYSSAPSSDTKISAPENGNITQSAADSRGVFATDESTSAISSIAESTVSQAVGSGNSEWLGPY